MASTAYPRFRLLRTPGERRYGVAIDRGPRTRNRFRYASAIRDIDSKPLAQALVDLMNTTAQIMNREHAHRPIGKKCRGKSS